MLSIVILKADDHAGFFLCGCCDKPPWLTAAFAMCNLQHTCEHSDFVHLAVRFFEATVALHSSYPIELVNFLNWKHGDRSACLRGQRLLHTFWSLGSRHWQNRWLHNTSEQQFRLDQSPGSHLKVRTVLCTVFNRNVSATPQQWNWVSGNLADRSRDSWRVYQYSLDEQFCEGQGSLCPIIKCAL